MISIKEVTLKMAISATVALGIANIINIKYAPVVAILAILSIQDTRQEAIKIGRKRMIACLLGQVVSIISYFIIGKNTLGFFVFLIIFIPITFKLNIKEGMVPSVVLSTHLLSAYEITYSLIINEVLIIFIGIGVAIIANLFTKPIDEEFEKNKELLEEYFKVIINKMAKSLLTNTVDIDEIEIINNIKETLQVCNTQAYKLVNNQFLKVDTYYTDYINMRINQFNQIEKMRMHFDKFNMSLTQIEVISQFTRSIADNISETNDCNGLLNELNDIKDSFKNMELPQCRREFENRAQLLQFMNDLEEFLVIKRNFIANLLRKESN